MTSFAQPKVSQDLYTSADKAGGVICFAQVGLQAAFAAGASYGAGLAGNPRAHSQTLGVREVALVLRAVSAPTADLFLLSICSSNLEWM